MSRTDPLPSTSTTSENPASSGTTARVAGMPFLTYFSPHLSIVLQVLAKYLQVDISYILSALFVFMTISTTFRLNIFDTVSSFFVSTIELRMDDEVFNQVMYWISKQEFSHKASRTVAITQFRNLQWFSEAASIEEEDEVDPNEDFDTAWRKRRSRSKVKPILLTPAEGETWFRYKGHLIRFRRFRVGRDAALPWERLTLMCFGRSNAILKQLIEEAQQLYSSRDGNKTVIYRAVQVGPEWDWRRCALLNRRKLESVIIHKGIKSDLLQKLQWFLSPKTIFDYRQRGQPHRIGCMLHGPPGTGKTSLCFALAGELLLPIYLLSLTSKSMTDEGLATLFYKLPKECIVLLEDVDAAGITTKRVSMTRPRHTDFSSSQSVDRTPNDKVGGSISLSGLLNVIDGVAAPEGRILIMTSNHAENLDPALTRPGRVDFHIKLDYADREMIKEFFMAMYKPLDSQSVDLSHLENLAERFADTIPNKEVTPAELQTYLLYYRDSPEQALQNAFSWPHLSSEDDEVSR